MAIPDFFVAESIPFVGSGESPSCTRMSFFPCIIRRALEILSCSELVVYKELLAAFVPSATNFIHTYEEGLVTPSLRVQVSKSLRGLKMNDNLKVVMTDQPVIEGLWSMVPMCINSLDHADLHTHICSTNCLWNHKVNPTIYLSTTFDSLCNAKNISTEEKLHILLKGFMIAFHELGHLLHLYIHFPNVKRTPETLHASVFSSQPVGKRRAGECVEEVALGGIFNIDITGGSAHDYRLSGYTFRSKMLVVGSQERITDVIDMLTSTTAIHQPGPPLPPFPCFAHPEDVIPMHSSVYRGLFPTNRSMLSKFNLNMKMGISSPSINSEAEQVEVNLNQKYSPYGPYIACGRFRDHQLQLESGFRC